jgi:hypothetical protein
MSTPFQSIVKQEQTRIRKTSQTVEQRLKEERKARATKIINEANCVFRDTLSHDDEFFRYVITTAKERVADIISGNIYQYGVFGSAESPLGSIIVIQIDPIGVSRDEPGINVVIDNLTPYEFSIKVVERIQMSKGFKFTDFEEIDANTLQQVELWSVDSDSMIRDFLLAFGLPKE